MRLFFVVFIPFLISGCALTVKYTETEDGGIIEANKKGAYTYKKGDFEMSADTKSEPLIQGLKVQNE